MSGTTDGLRTTVTTTVTPDQIDHLGHMNVRFYAVHARAGDTVLARELGLDLGDGLRLQLTDAYTKHRREQLVGAPLEVRSAPLGADGPTLRSYHELRNTDTGDLAATFVHAVDLVTDHGRDPRTLPDRVIERAQAGAIDVPDHGRPRSLTLDPETSPVPLAVLRERGLAMRKVRTITAEECESDGVYDATAFGDLVWGGEPIEGHEGWLFGPDNESPIGMATMESRATINRLPRAGDRVQSFGAEVDLGAKTSHRRQWVYDVERETPLMTFSVLGLTFDLRTRKAVDIPEPFRTRLERDLHADLAPAPAG